METKEITKNCIQNIANNYACYAEEKAEEQGIRHQKINEFIYDAICRIGFKYAGIIEGYFEMGEEDPDQIAETTYTFCNAIEDEIIIEFGGICEKIAEDFGAYEISYKEITFDAEAFCDITIMEIENPSMSFETAQNIIFDTAYEFTSKITGNPETNYGENPTFDRIYDKMITTLFDIVIEERKEGNI